MALRGLVPIENSVVLVTGASSGIGAALARAFAASGARVYGTSRKANASPPAPGIRMLALEATDEGSVAACVQTVLSAEGRLDILVCNAGMGFGGAIEDLPLESVQKQFDVNVFGVLRLLRAVLPGMRERASGLVLLIGSAAGRVSIPFQAHYAASKHALEAIVEALRLEVRPFGIRACIIEPGDTRTGFTDTRTICEASPVYAAASARAIGVMERDERSGFAPERVAALALAIARKRRPRVRYSVGPLFQRMALALKRVLPSKVFEAALAIYYKTGRPA